MIELKHMGSRYNCTTLLSELRNVCSIIIKCKKVLKIIISVVAGLVYLAQLVNLRLCTTGDDGLCNVLFKIIVKFI